MCHRVSDVPTYGLNGMSGLFRVLPLDAVDVSISPPSAPRFRYVFSHSGSPTILVFPYQTGWQYSDGDPPNGGVECKGYEKITIFDQYRALSRN